MSLYRTLHRPRVAIRATPSTQAEIVHVLAAGEIFRAVLQKETNGWVKLAEDEAWARQIMDGFVLIDGAQLGLGKLIEQLEQDDEELWPFTPALRRAAALGVPFKQGHLRPMDAQKVMQSWLSFWHSPEHTEPVMWLNDPGLQRNEAPKLPKLALATLLRGVPAAVIRSFAIYHQRIGFDLLMLYFDAPNDPDEQQAIQVAESLPGVRVQCCTDAWWKETLQSSRFQHRRDRGSIYSETMELWEMRDVQSRQCLAIETALVEAQRQGYDWLLHIDADELLLVPKHPDARHFFQRLPSSLEQVVFNNLEAVPESLHVVNCFEEVSLFKVHQNFLKESELEKPHSERYLQKLERWRQRQIAKGTDPEDVRSNRSFDMAMLPVRLARRKVVQELQLELPSLDAEDQEPFDSDEEPEKRRQNRYEDLPCFFTAYGNGKAACRVLPSLPLPVGVHRFASDVNARLSSMRCSEEGAPVVLHYANCGYGPWLRKYEMLAVGHGTEDGGFSIDRKGIKSMRAHLAHRELLKRGNPVELERYYRTYIMGNEFGELPFFACHGMLARTHAVQRVLGVEKE